MKKKITQQKMGNLMLSVIFSVSICISLFSEPLKIEATYTGDYIIAYNPIKKTSKELPKPFIIKNQKDFEAFLKNLPKTMPADSSVMGGGGDVSYRDALIMGGAPDWKNFMLVVIVDGSTRKGPLEFESADYNEKTIKVKVKVLDRGPEAREVQKGYYTAFLLPKKKGNLILEKEMVKEDPKK